MRLQVVYTETLESPRLFRRKALNSTQGKGSSTAWFRRLCWRQRKLILPQRNGDFLGAFSVACGFGATGFSLEGRIHTELCHRPSVYLAEAGVRTGSHAWLGVRFLIWRSPQEHLDRCTHWNVFARARARCHRCGAW